MGQAYAPGLRVATKTVIRKERILPLKGDVLKKKGDKVRRDEVVANTALPGNVSTINVVNVLGIQADEIDDFMLKKVGDTFEKGELLAESKSFIKFLRTRVPAPIKGSVESISTITGQVLLREPPMPVEVYGYLNGEVVEVIPNEGIVVETVATFVQGIFGIGGEIWGTLKFLVKSPEEELDLNKITDKHKGQIIVGGSFASYQAIKKAISVGVKGIIVGGICAGDLGQILGYDLGVAITGSEDVGVTLLLTEGFGKIAMAERTFKTLKEREGAVASISGATQIRAGVIRPEIIIPYDGSSKENLSTEGNDVLLLDIGTNVRAIRPPYFGKIGTVTELPHELTKIESETKARILKVKFNDGINAVLPRANVEIIGS